MAKLTIGMFGYNEERYIGKTIESVLKQSFQDFRLYISDNCSTDRTYAIACEYASKDPRIEVYRQPENVGAPKSSEFVLRKADTPCFMWLAAHDILLEHYLTHAVELLETTPECVLAYPKSYLIDQKNVILKSLYDDIDTQNLSLRNKLCKVAQNLYCCFSTHGVFRTDILKRLPFESMIGSDFLILFAAATYGDIYLLDSYGLKMRKVREESAEEAEKRWQETGIYSEYPGLSPYALTILRHLEYIRQCKRFTFQDKAILFYRIYHIFLNRWGIKWYTLLRQKISLLNTLYVIMRPYAHFRSER